MVSSRMLLHDKNSDCYRLLTLRCTLRREDKARNVNGDLKTLLWAVTVNKELPQFSKYICLTFKISYRSKRESACAFFKIYKLRMSCATKFGLKQFVSILDKNLQKPKATHFNHYFSHFYSTSSVYISLL